jgi:transglutaminase-like putative cysteine protease
MTKLALGCVVVLLALTATVHAQDAAFDTTYNIEYTVTNSLVVSVKEHIGVINQTAEAVPSSFIETITNISIYDIKVLDANDQELQPEITSTPGQLETKIKIPIKDPAVGKAKKTELTLVYKTKDLAVKTGRILNLHIPKAPVSKYMQEYNVRITIPRDFGPQMGITPAPVEERREEEGYVLVYNKQALEKYGISASFGDYQIFDFALNYILKNDSWLAKEMAVPIPLPIRNYQEIAVTEISPKPIRLKKDADGNILAFYKPTGKSTLPVKVAGKAKVYTLEAGAINTTASPIIPADLTKYTRSQPYWESQADAIVELARSITAKDKTVEDNALALYSYITTTIEYDHAAAQTGGNQARKGAVQTLQDKKGLCLDFTDLFIALARSAGIPAREIDGYAYAKELGIAPNALHSWVQYYNPKVGWVAIDPTWGATSGLDYFSKLDNNHLAFGIKGVDSQQPQPAASFVVEFSTDDYFNRTGLYDLDALPQDSDLTALSSVVKGVIGLGLGLCTIAAVLKVRARNRYK